MQLKMLQAKIHRARVTEANPDYEGRITVDRDLLDAAGMLPYQAVAVYNISNGNRLETYTLPGERGAGVICLNGAAALLCGVGDRVIICAYAQMDPLEARVHTPRVLLVDESNRPRKRIRYGDRTHVPDPA